MFLHLFCPGGLQAPWARPLELRLDVNLPEDQLANELSGLARRLGTPGDPLHALPGFRLNRDYRARHREADGEHYLYIQHLPSGEFAGCIVFNRLIEVDKRTDRIVRSPHARIDAGHRRRGIARLLYRHALDHGMCLLSGARQSAGAHALWQELARDYPHGYLRIEGKRLVNLGARIPLREQEDLHTRSFLLGAGWSLARFAQRTGMQSGGQQSRYALE